MNQAQKLLDAFDVAYSADHYAAEKILQKLQRLYKNTSNQWIKAQIRLKEIAINDAFKRNKEDEHFAHELLAYFEKNDHKYEVATILLNRVNFLLNKGDFINAEKYLQELQDKNLTEITISIACAYRALLANVHARKQEHAQRLTVCIEAFKRLETATSKDSEWYRLTLLFSSNLIEIYIANEEFNSAAPYVEQALKIIEEQQVNWTTKIYALKFIAEYYALQKDFKNAFKYYNIAKKSINSNDYGVIYLNISNSFIQTSFSLYETIPASSKKKRLALLHEIENGIFEIRDHKDCPKLPLLQIVIPNSIGKLALLQKNYEKAIEHLNKALQIISTTQPDTHRFFLINYRIQYAVYNQLWLETGDFQKLKEAYFFLQKIHEIVELLSNEKVKNRLDAVRGYYELEQKKLNEKLLQQRVEAIDKELQMTNLNLHEKVMVLDDLKKYIENLKADKLKAKVTIDTINKKIDSVKITEQEKALLHQKMTETGKYLTTILSKKYPNLTPLEIRMCAFFQTGVTNKELAKLYGQTERAYRQQRYRIKKKMNLPAEENLVKYLSSL